MACLCIKCNLFGALSVCELQLSAPWLQMQHSDRRPTVNCPICSYCSEQCCNQASALHQSLPYTYCPMIRGEYISNQDRSAALQPVYPMNFKAAPMTPLVVHAALLPHANNALPCEQRFAKQPCFYTSDMTSNWTSAHTVPHSMALNS